LSILFALSDYVYITCLMDLIKTVAFETKGKCTACLLELHYIFPCVQLYEDIFVNGSVYLYWILKLLPL